MKLSQGRLVIAPSHEVSELAHGIARALNDGRLAQLPLERRNRLREVAMELSVMASDECDREETEVQSRQPGLLARKAYRG